MTNIQWLVYVPLPRHAVEVDWMPCPYWLLVPSSMMEVCYNVASHLSLHVWKLYYGHCEAIIDQCNLNLLAQVIAFAIISSMISLGEMLMSLESASMDQGDGRCLDGIIILPFLTGNLLFVMLFIVTFSQMVIWLHWLFNFITQQVEECKLVQ